MRKGLEKYFSNIYWNNLAMNGSCKYSDFFGEIMKCETEGQISNRIKEISLKTVKNIIEDGISIEEYSSKYGVSLKQLKQMIKIVKRDYRDIYEEFNNKCKETSNEFYDYIKWIAMDMYNRGDSFDIFDYYYYTRLSSIVFKNICKKLLNEEEQKKSIQF